jgi:dipeptide/tripeptide permease
MTSTEEASACCGLTILQYPLSVAFIIAQEFCERFAYYGMRTILSM